MPGLRAWRGSGAPTRAMFSPLSLRYQFFGASPLLGGRQLEAEFYWGGCNVSAVLSML